jgi:hypothetical protein
VQRHRKEAGKAGAADGRTEQEAGTRLTGHDELFGKLGGRVCVCGGREAEKEMPESGEVEKIGAAAGRDVQRLAGRPTARDQACVCDGGGHAVRYSTSSSLVAVYRRSRGVKQGRDRHSLGRKNRQVARVAMGAVLASV